MARTIKRTVDYFPHVVKPGKTLFILEARWGLHGYAFMWKLYETLCESDGMFLDFSNEISREVFLAKTRVSEQDAIAMLNVMARLDNINRELWDRSRIVWSQDLVDNLSEVWRRRAAPPPTRPDLCRQYDGNNPAKPPFSGINDGNNSINDGRNRQSKVEESREEERGTVFPNDNDNVIDSEKDKTNTPSPASAASPSSPAGETGSAAPTADDSDATIKGQDLSDADTLAVAGFYCDAKKLRFANEAARATYLRSGGVYFPARDLLALAGGDVALAQRAITEHAFYYDMPEHNGTKAKWDLTWVRRDFPVWDTERRAYDEERVRGE